MASRFTCVQLLSESSDATVSFFVANIVYSKIRRHWNQLAAQEREQLTAFLQNLILKHITVTEEAKGGSEAILSRLILCFVCCGALTPQGLLSYTSLALSLLQSEEGDSMKGRKEGVGLEMLAVLPEEVEALDLSRPARLELQQQLASVCVSVLTAIESVCRRGGGQGEGETMVLRALRGWSTSQGILTLSKLQTDLPHAWLTVASSFTLPSPVSSSSLASNRAQRLKEACHLMRDLIAIKEFPLSKDRVLALKTLTAVLIAPQTLSSMAMLFTRDNHDLLHEYNEVALDVCDFFVCLISSEMGLFSSEEGFQTDLFLLLLHSAACRPR